MYLCFSFSDICSIIHFLTTSVFQQFYLPPRRTITAQFPNEIVTVVYHLIYPYCTWSSALIQWHLRSSTSGSSATSISVQERSGHSTCPCSGTTILDIVGSSPSRTTTAKSYNGNIWLVRSLRCYGRTHTRASHCFQQRDTATLLQSPPSSSPLYTSEIYVFQRWFTWLENYLLCVSRSVTWKLQLLFK